MKQLLSILLFALSMQVSANAIEGAFGLKLGEVVPQGFKCDKFLWSDTKKERPYWFRFKPESPMLMYDKYSFQVSPIGKKVVSIKAESPDTCKHSNSFRDYEDLREFLDSKYGEHDYTNNKNSYGSHPRYISLGLCELEYYDYNLKVEAEKERRKLFIDKYSKFDI